MVCLSLTHTLRYGPKEGQKSNSTTITNINSNSDITTKINSNSTITDSQGPPVTKELLKGISLTILPGQVTTPPTLLSHI